LVMSRRETLLSWACCGSCQTIWNGFDCALRPILVQGTQAGVPVLPRLWRLVMARRHVNERGKSRRAYAAHLDLLDTADWWRALMSGQLARLGIKMKAFRVLERLYRRGGMYQRELSRTFLCSKQAIAKEIRYLEKWGWVRRVGGRLEPSDAAVTRREAAALISEDVSGSEAWKERADRWGEPEPKASSVGRKVVRLELTEKGMAMMEQVLPVYVKRIKSEMRALDGREQLTLCRLLRKLRRGDPVRWIRELHRKDEGAWEIDSGFVVAAGGLMKMVEHSTKRRTVGKREKQDILQAGILGSGPG
jgi:DNA-binding MarR family transcriptional regulator